MFTILRPESVKTRQALGLTEDWGNKRYKDPYGSII
jgi:hypothetical protein